MALLYASKSLDAVKDKLENFDQTVGVQILQTALRIPLKTIADNAGMPLYNSSVQPVTKCWAN